MAPPQYLGKGRPGPVERNWVSFWGFDRTFNDYAGGCVTLVLDKARLRKECRRVRRAHFAALGIDGRRAAAARLADFACGPDGPLAELSPLMSGPDSPLIAAGYWPRKSEIDPRLLMARLAEAGCILALPVVTGEGMPLIFREWSPGVDLETGFYEIPVPVAQTAQVEPDIALVPMIGFDARLNRLGQGGGYYDRTFARKRPKLVIGLAYDVQQVPDTAVDAGDQPMDFIVTDAGIYRKPEPLV